MAKSPELCEVTRCSVPRFSPYVDELIHFDIYLIPFSYTVIDHAHVILLFRDVQKVELPHLHSSALALIGRIMLLFSLTIMHRWTA